MRKKKIAIISSQYFWLPEESGPSRFFSIAKCFKANGYNVDIYTSSFEHHEKKQRKLLNNTDFNIFYIKSPSYKKNVDIRREYSNIVFASKTIKLLKQKIKDYSVVYCSIPPNNIGKKVGKLCKEHNVPFVVDIEDLWPEAMVPVFNKLVRKIFKPYEIDAEMTYKMVDGVVGTSDEYTARAWLKNKRNIPHKTVYVGCDVKAFDEEVNSNLQNVNKPDNEFWVIYTGSIGHSYAIDNIVKAAKLMDKYNDVRFKILGDGPLRADCEKLAEDLNCRNIDFLGYVSHSVMAAYLTKSDITINSFAKGAAQSIVNKIGDYLAAGKPMINTLENEECCKLVNDFNVGINVPPEKPEVLVSEIIKLYNSRELCSLMGLNSRKLAEQKFDRETSYKEIVNLAEKCMK